MVGADAVVVHYDIETKKFHATDYKLTAQAQVNIYIIKLFWIQVKILDFPSVMVERAFVLILE